MEIVDSPVPGSAALTFITPPSLRMLDQTGAALTQVGSNSDPWQVEVTLLTSSSSHGSATLDGSTTAEFVYGGTVTFTDLSISHAGEYALRFQVVSPDEADPFTVDSDYFTVVALELTGGLANYTEPLIVDEEFSFEVQIYDGLTNEPVDDISWQVRKNLN